MARVFKFIQDNDGVTSKEVYEALGIPGGGVHCSISHLLRRGLITKKSIAGHEKFGGECSYTYSASLTKKPSRNGYKPVKGSDLEKAYLHVQDREATSKEVGAALGIPGKEAAKLMYQLGTRGLVTKRRVKGTGSVKYLFKAVRSGHEGPPKLVDGTKLKKVYLIIQRSGKAMTSKEIHVESGYERQHVHRMLQDLLKRGHVERNTIFGQGDGCSYAFTAVPEEEAQS